MLKGIVIGNVVSTRKQDALVGSKFLEIEVIENGKKTGKYLIAVDSVGAGIGETVLVTTGSSARLALRNTSAPTDAVVVGIVEYGKRAARRSLGACRHGEGARPLTRPTAGRTRGKERNRKETV